MSTMINVVRNHAAAGRETGFVDLAGRETGFVADELAKILEV